MDETSCLWVSLPAWPTEVMCDKMHFFKPSAKAAGLGRSRQFPGILGISCSAGVSSGSDAYYSSAFVLSR